MGHRIWPSVIADADELGAVHGFDHGILWVHPDNARTLAFYAARAWADTGERRRGEVMGIDVPEAPWSKPLR